MPRTLHVTVRPAATDGIVDALTGTHGVLAVRVSRGESVHPPGDVISLDVLDRGLQDVAALLDHDSIQVDADSSVMTSSPLSLVSSKHAVAIANDISEATWEEMDALMAREGNMTLNALLLMAGAGALATIGLAENALHLVIAAMLIAPGFEPIVRGALRIVARADSPLLGWQQLAQAYGALLVGAALTAVALRAFGTDPAGGSSSYLPAGILVDYWTTISPMSLAVAAVAGIAGALLVASHRSVLTAGVMVALALVPGATIAGIGLTSLDVGLAAQGAARWLVEVALVTGASMAVFALKRATVHRGRRMT